MRILYTTCVVYMTCCTSCNMFGTAYEPSSSFATYEDKISFEQIVVSSTTVCLVSVGVCNIADEKQHI